MRHALNGSIAIPYRLDNEASLRQLVATWTSQASELMPQRAGAGEPVRTPFDPSDIAAALPAWLSGVWIARRTRPSMHASFLTNYLHTAGNISVAGGESELDALAALIRSLFLSFSGDFGMVHRLTAAETAEARAEDRVDLTVVNSRTGAALLSTGFTKRLQSGLPTLYWTTLFGRTYVDLFGRKTLLSTPAYKVEEFADGVAILLTAVAPTDDDWSTFRGARELAVEHLGRDAFAPGAARVAAAMKVFDPEPWPPKLSRPAV